MCADAFHSSLISPIGPLAPRQRPPHTSRTQMRYSLCAQRGALMSMHRHCYSCQVAYGHQLTALEASSVYVNAARGELLLWPTLLSVASRLLSKAVSYDICYRSARAFAHTTTLLWVTSLVPNPNIASIRPCLCAAFEENLDNNPDLFAAIWRFHPGSLHGTVSDRGHAPFRTPAKTP